MELYGSQKSPTLMEIVHQNCVYNRIIYLEAITGLTNLKYALDDSEPFNNLDELELLIKYFSKRIYSDLFLEPINFLIEIIGFKEECLNRYGLLNESLYDNLDYYDILEVDFIKIITYPGNSDYNVETDNLGFPDENNFVEGTENTFQQLPGKRSSKTWIPFLLSRSFNLIDLSNLLKTKLNDNCTLLFHGCQWESARSIQREIKLTPRNFPSDFGYDNFYVGNNLEAAISWSLKGNYPAIVIFSIPNDFISHYINLKLNDYNITKYNEWKSFVYKNRKNTSFAHDTDESYEIISGPILKNPCKIRIVDDCKKLVYNNITVYQTSFKTTDICKELNKYILTTIYLPQCSTI